MEKLIVCLFLAIACNQAMVMSLRQKRQDNSVDLQDRFTWNVPVGNLNQFQPNRPGQGGKIPGQEKGQVQYPGQFPEQWHFAGEEKLSGQGGQFSGQGQGQLSWEMQGQLPDKEQGDFSGQGQWNFPGQWPLPGPGQGQLQQKSTTQAPASSSTTQSAAILQCIRSCPVTSEYNPVCGTNNVSYDNPGRLICARDCGTNVTQRRMGKCPIKLQQ